MAGNSDGMLVVTGLNTTIVQHLLTLIKKDKVVRVPGELQTFEAGEVCNELPLDAERYVLAAGLLHAKRTSEQTSQEIAASLAVNLISVVQLCEVLLEHNDRARICVIGSESGIKGSYDLTYALSKAALHRYVEFRATGPKQQLVCVAPGMIENSGMTERRADQAHVQRKIMECPKKRGLRAIEVAQMVHSLLWVDQGYTNNVVIRMDGGVRC